MDSTFIILLLLIAAVFSFYSSPGKEPLKVQQASLSQTPEDISQEQKQNISQNQTKKEQSFLTSDVQKTIEPPKSSLYIDTYITRGPKEGEIIEKTNKITFEFKSKTVPETEETIYFETKIEGFDDDWKKTSSKKRIINLPPGPKKYTFLVRAKIKDVIDLTPAKRNFKINTSPYFDKVKISSIRIQTTSRPSLITLSAHLKKGEEINITDWRIRGKAGSFVIPPGIEKYHPGYNPVPKESIFVKQGDIIYLSGDLNPLGRNRNFRPNKCMGYLANYRDFSIPLPKNCPKPKRDEISHLHPCCQEFILKMRTCEIPDYSQNYSVARDSECVSYLNKNFNYGGCFRNYSRDEDFLRKNWHIYLNGKDITVTNTCDIIYLRDQNGLVVATYSYGYPVCK